MKASPQRAARAAHLRYVSDSQVAGITRHGAPGRFFYRLPSGRKLRDPKTLQRIRALAIPPAWRDVWIAPFANAHLAATGRDARGRKQYRYHPAFAAGRNQDKFHHLTAFARSLPRIRRRLQRDMKRPGLPREKILATIALLLEKTLIRVGNEDYARTNHSFGLTTLRNQHVTVRGEALQFVFRGKSGKPWRRSLHDRRVAKVLKACQELPGQHLFEYEDGAGAVHAVSSTDVNEYLRAISGAQITAKDFRTWAGTMDAAIAFAAQTAQPKARAITKTVAQVAQRLGNTVAVCRKCYIHPAIIAGFEKNRLRLSRRAAMPGLSKNEAAVLAFLEKA